MTNNFFVRQFIKSSRTVGSIMPSSRFLSRRMLSPIRFDLARVIVEFGPGTGVFTRELLASMHPSCKLVSIELNFAFFEKLKSEFPKERMSLIHGSAIDLGEHLRELQLPDADYIVSSLPLSNFPVETRDAIIIESNARLKENGKFIQYLYKPSGSKLFKRHFASVQMEYTALNVPPAYVYICTKGGSAS